MRGRLAHLSGGTGGFHRDAITLGARKKALCERFGMIGRFPLDAGLPPDVGRASAAIYAACLGMMREAEAGIFNLTPFRGPSADVGTVLELGMMAGWGKPVFAYSNVDTDLLERLEGCPGLAYDEATGLWRDPLGMSAEDFGNADNLMLDETLAAQGRRIHRRCVAEADRFTDLAGFETCRREAALV